MGEILKFLAIGFIIVGSLVLFSILVLYSIKLVEHITNKIKSRSEEQDKEE